MTGSYKVVLKASAKGELWNIPFPHRRRIVHRLVALQREPRPSGCEDLGKGRWRLREAQWSVLYKVDEAARVVRVFRIGR